MDRSVMEEIHKAAQHIMDLVDAMAAPPPLESVQTIFSQRDARWGKDKMGGTFIPVSQEGCLMTAVSAGLANAGYDTDPGRLNKWLSENRGYVSGTNHFIFNAIDSLGVAKFKVKIDSPSTPADVARLEEWRNAGNFAVVEVDFSAAPGTQQHWVLYQGDGTCMDPWYGDFAPIVPRYQGKDAAQAILAIAYYEVIKHG